MVWTCVRCWFELVGTCLTTGAAIGAVVIAAKGLMIWRRELHGRTEYDLARRILVDVYRVREAIQGVRNPWMASAEWSDRPDRTDSNPDTPEDMVFAYDKRWLPLSAALVDLRANLLEGEVLWEEKLASAHESLENRIAELGASLTTFLQARAGDGEDARKQVRAMQATVFAPVDPARDAFRTEVLGAIAEFEAELRPFL